MAGTSCHILMPRIEGLLLQMVGAIEKQPEHSRTGVNAGSEIHARFAMSGPMSAATANC